MGGLYRQNLGRIKKLLAKETKGTFLEGGWQGAYQADYLTNGDQEVPD